MVCENVVRDVPGNYPVIWRVTKPRTLGHAGYVPKSILEVRPRLILFFLMQTLGFFTSLCTLPGDHLLSFWKGNLLLTKPDIVI